MSDDSCALCGASLQHYSYMTALLDSLCGKVDKSQEYVVKSFLLLYTPHLLYVIVWGGAQTLVTVATSTILLLISILCPFSNLQIHERKTSEKYSVIYFSSYFLPMELVKLQFGKYPQQRLRKHDKYDLNIGTSRQF